MITGIVGITLSLSLTDSLKDMSIDNMSLPRSRYYKNLCKFCLYA